MKVMLATFWDYPHIGGVSTHIGLLAKGLRELGHQVAVISRDLAIRIGVPEEAEFRKYLRSYLALCQNTQSISPFVQNLETGRSLYEYTMKMVNFGQFDVIHCHDVVSAEIIGRLTDKPLLLTVHGYLANESISDGLILRGSFEEKYLLAIEQSGLKQSRGVVAVDSKIHDYIKSRFAYTGQLVAMKNFVDAARFANLNKEQLRTKIGIPQEAFLIICPRRLVEKNGVIYAIKAMEIVARKLPAAVLLCLGDGPKRQEIEEYIAARRLNSCCVAQGSVPHEAIIDYYGAADAILVPSVPSEGVEEATSLSALEGMASARVVIASSIGGLKELIDDRKTGILVPPGDSEALAKSLVDIAADPGLAAQLGTKAQKKICQKHSHIAAAQTIADLYSQCVS
jgi:Glycosyltransferase